MFFGSLDSVLRILVTCVLAYAIIIFELRITGKRTLSKMNSFDFIVTVALGSMLAAVILQQSVPLIDAMLGIGLLIALQYGVTWLSTRSRTVLNLVKGTPSLVFYDGEFLSQTMNRERVAKEEVYAAVRASGFAHMEKVHAVVLETDGNFTVIGPIEDGKDKVTALRGVYRYEAGRGVEIHPEG
jgi:uncharacterized membrane protein YcaP (DUF421 family)